MEVSVLERQRAVLQRIHHDQEHHHFNADSAAVDHHHHHQQQLLWQHSLNSDHDHQTIHPNPQTNERRRSCSADNSSSLTALKPDWQCNSSSSASKSNKRKAEFPIEGESDQDDRVEEEAAAAEEKSDITTKAETSANTSSKESLKASEVHKQDYIHVRARRGQATDSHSLAERARREKITKKMKCLQDLVPGCNKVTGKAGMLDEIINYVQSLQKQVEFLSMKLATVNPRLDFSIDNLFAKEIPAYIASCLQPPPPPPAATTQMEYNQMHLGISNYTGDVAGDQSHIISCQKAGGASSFPIPEVFLDHSCISQLQNLSGWETDWQNLFSAGFQ